ncbi:uncharacterized protein METZ01_LOCUS124548 [marine metagenome]|uniref:Uncharacterized protein n=1 Tax=marine metagenome TaxID=408172 RepID=A0A381Y3U1_9ZZZZ
MNAPMEVTGYGRFNSFITIMFGEP